ncbi:hypothetical protein SY83_16170 [Paenibacillus swuensis]|uniref:Uncharacterized protein n=1 Tax=Paenibacillus swuensis TaxID=1178515 RepID=A0A172TLB2_9BACL|nr:hypothetical protein [Paenibacillus swuensis]ANE47563.1 hypothetical protein SY83_16170 [Paenibacillus swuensis]
MSLRSIEMQIAIPRTNDITPIQKEMNQKPSIDQQLLAEHATKLADEARSQSTRMEETDKSGVSDRERKGAPYIPPGKRRKNSKQHPDQAKSEHPFKGHHIDVSF